MKKRVNVFASAPLDFGFAAPLIGPYHGIVKDTDQIKIALHRHVMVQEILPNGKLVQLTMKNYDKDNSLPVKQTGPIKNIVPTVDDSIVTKVDQNGLVKKPEAEADDSAPTMIHTPPANDPMSEVIEGKHADLDIPVITDQPENQEPAQEVTGEAEKAEEPEAPVEAEKADEAEAPVEAAPAVADEVKVEETVRPVKEHKKKHK